MIALFVGLVFGLPFALTIIYLIYSVVSATSVPRPDKYYRIIILTPTVIKELEKEGCLK